VISLCIEVDHVTKVEPILDQISLQCDNQGVIRSEGAHPSPVVWSSWLVNMNERVEGSNGG